MRLFDTHCHLQDERLAPHLDAVLRRAADAGVAAMLCCGSTETDWEPVRQLAYAHPAVIRPAYGLHPWYVADRSPRWMETLRSFIAVTRQPPEIRPVAAPLCRGVSMPGGRAPGLQHEKLAALPIVGEIGLDHAVDKATFAAQEECLLAQIQLAAELHRPVSLHCRRAWGRLMELLDAHGWPPDGVILHSYSGGRELIAPLARRGAYFSFSGAITHQRNVRGREAAAAVPEDRLLIESDAPDIPAALAPDTPCLRDAEGKPLSEPANLLLTLRALAALRHVSEDSLATTLWQNSEHVLAWHEETTAKK